MRRLEAAVILAGGLSLRMGREKALLEASGATLFERLALTLASRFETLLASVGADGPSAGLAGALSRLESTGLHLSIVRDACRDRGPLAGVAAALEEIRAEKALFVAVDIPQISFELFDALWTLSSEPGALGAVPCWKRGLEPACAVYSKVLKPIALRLLDEGPGSLHSLARSAGVRVLDLTSAEAIRAHLGRGLDPAQLFRNLNCPEDYAALTEAEEG